MKSRILLMIVLTLLSANLFGQALNWRESGNATNDVAIIKESTIINGGTYSAKTDLLIGTPYIYSDEFNVTAGSAYTFSIDVLDNVPARYKIYCEFKDALGVGIAGQAPVYSTDNANWQTITWSSTVPVSAVKAYVWIKIYTEVGFVSPASLYLDNAVFTMDGGSNLVLNGGFEGWTDGFISYQFAGLSPAVAGTFDYVARTCAFTVPYGTDLTALVGTFTILGGATATVGATDQVSGTTPNNFTSPITYTVTNGTEVHDWVFTVSVTPPKTGKDIFSFNIASPEVAGTVKLADHTISIEVPFGTDVTALVPTITLSPSATVSPLSEVAQNFTSAVNYTVTAQDGSTQVWIVTVTFSAEGQTTIFFEDFKTGGLALKNWTIINNDGLPPLAGDEAWIDSAWLVSTSGRPEIAGNLVAMASSEWSDTEVPPLPNSSKADDWMILPTITLGDYSTLSWNAMSTTKSGNFPDDYTVYIAPALPSPAVPTVQYMKDNANEIFRVAPESTSAYAANPGAGLAFHSVNLKEKITPSAANGWFSQDVWIAFVDNTDLYTNPLTGIPNGTPGGAYLAIDNIKVVNGPATGFSEYKKNTLSVSIFPNPTTGAFKIAVEAESFGIADIKVMDLSGRIVFTSAATVNVGKNQIDVNLSNLHEGIYLINTTVNGKVNVSKLNVR